MPPQPANHNDTQLPKIPLLQFSDNYKDWVSFRDLFTELVVKSNRSASAKLYSLKESLSDEPLYLMKNLTVSEGRFEEQIWLLEKYDNERHIIYAHMNSLLSLKPMSGESADQLRKLLNKTTDCVEVIKAI